MSQYLLDKQHWRLSLGATIVPLLLLTACSGRNDHLIRGGMTEDEVVRLIGKPTVTFGEKTKFGGFFDENKECRPKLVKVMLYDRSRRKDVLVGINAAGIVECVATADGVAVTDFHK